VLKSPCFEREQFEPRFLGHWPACGTDFPVRHRAHYTANPEQTWPKQDKIVDIGRRMIAGASCALVGDRGTGKTQIAYWLARRLREHGYCKQWYYFTAADLFGLMKSWFDLGCHEKSHNDRQIFTVPLLVIDEMQERIESEFEDKMLTHVVDKRYGAMLPTLLIANIKPSELQAKLGTSVVSRISEGGANLLCDWASFRTPQKSLQHTQTEKL
jgi:DNA replication protein DnaC